MPPSKQQLELFPTGQPPEQPKAYPEGPSIITNLPHVHPDLMASIEEWSAKAVTSVRRDADMLLASGIKLSAEEQADMVLKAAEREFEDRGIQFVRVGKTVMVLPDGVSEQNAREALGYKRD